MRFLFSLLVVSCAFRPPVAAQAPNTLVGNPRGLSPLAYFQLTESAALEYGSENYTAAAASYKSLTDAYPFNGEHWLRLGESYFRLGRYYEAADAFGQADRFGVTPYPQWNAAYAALSHALTGETDNAEVWLEKTLQEYRFERPKWLLTDSLFLPLRQLPGFSELVHGASEHPHDRVEGWRHDLDILLAEIERLNPIYSRAGLPPSLTARAEWLRSEIPGLSDVQIALEMQHLLTHLGHNHNIFHYLFNPEEARRIGLTEIPVTFYAFPEGIYIIDAAPPNEHLIGAQVLAFEEVAAETALYAMSHVRSVENKVELIWRGVEMLLLPEALRVAGVVESADSVSLTLRDTDGTSRIVSLRPRSFETRGKIEAPRVGASSEPPLYLSRPDDRFWFELVSPNTLYFQFNQVSNKPDESLSDFAHRLRRFLAGNPKVDNLIVDVRRNNGGDTYLYPEFVQTLAAFDAEDDNSLFVIIGRSSFSATANFLADLDRLADAVFVGEPSGGKPLTRGGDSSTSFLPYSGLTVGLSSTIWQLTSPRDTRLWFTPDIPVSLTASDYFANRDPVLETIFDLIRQDD